MSPTDFKTGDYIIYINGDKIELGRIKRVTDDGAFVCYSEGETAAKTPREFMHPLLNGYTITESTLGGETFKQEGQT